MARIRAICRPERTLAAMDAHSIVNGPQRQRFAIHLAMVSAFSLRAPGVVK
jgi:hypothetical protein